MWSEIPKTQMCAVTICYSTCENTPTAASVVRSCNDSWSIATALYRGEYGNKKEYFFDTTPVIRGTVAAVGVPSHGVQRNVTRLCVFGTALHIKKTPPFLGTKRCNRFLKI
jgi:hypothetical protein